MKQLDPIQRSAVFSPCRTYRYSLSRHWAPKRGYALFIGLNPSTADELQDDPTIRRCVRFAKDWGYGGMVICNLYAFRATDPKVMMAANDPVGPLNDDWICRFSGEARVVVAAWGVGGRFGYRGHDFTFPTMYCLGRTKEGYPRHPLFVRADTKLELYV